jgi:hypothetical protein
MIPIRALNNERLTPVGGVLLTFLSGLFGSALAGVVVWLALSYTPLGGAVAWVLPQGEKAAWYLTRSSGTVAYLLLSGATVWGLLLSTRIVKERVPPPLAMALHSTLSWLAIGVAAFHVLALRFDSYYLYTLADLVVPFLGPYRPEWVGLGTIGLYGMILTSASFSFRKWLGNQRWRQLHYLTFPLYLLVTLHGFMAGTDSGEPGARGMYLGSILLVLFLTNYRLLTGHPSPTRG